MTLQKDLGTLEGHLDPLNHDANGIKFDNSSNGFVASDVQAAIEEAGNTLLISDTAYDATTWNGVTNVAPSKNAVRDEFEVIIASIVAAISDAVYSSGTWDGVTTIAPSKNAVRDKIEALNIQHVLDIQASTSVVQGAYTLTWSIPVSGGRSVNFTRSDNGNPILRINSGQIDFGPSMVPVTGGTADLGSSTVGLKNIYSCGGNQYENQTLTSTPQTLGVYFSNLVNTTTIGATATVNLPTAVGIKGRQYCIKNIGTSGYNVIVDANGSQTIDSNLTATLFDNEAIIIESDNANWWIVSSTPSIAVDTLDLAFLGQPFV